MGPPRPLPTPKNRKRTYIFQPPLFITYIGELPDLPILAVERKKRRGLRNHGLRIVALRFPGERRKEEKLKGEEHAGGKQGS